MSERYFACVYGGANDNIDIRHREKIENLGRIIAKAGVSLVYGAGATGCMGAVARGVKSEGGYVMGIAPHFIGGYERMFDCDEKVVVDTMAERKTIMEKHANIFFIAPGGIGTMDELFQVITLKCLGQMDEPVVVLNLDGFYDSLIELMNDLIKQGAATESVNKFYDVVTDVNEETILPFLEKIKK